MFYATSFTKLMLRKNDSSNSFILMYHRIKPAGLNSNLYSHTAMVVDEKTFDFQMKYLKDNFQVLPLSELVESLRNGGGNSRIRCSITFDDGWKDNFDFGFSILLKYGLPATIFLSTRFVNSSEWFWQDRLIFLFDKIIKDENILELSQDFPDSISTKVRFFRQKKMRDLRGFFDQCVEEFKELPSQKRDNLIDELSNLTRCNLPRNGLNRYFLNWDEIRQMHREGISFGCHGVSHQLLTQLPFQRVEEEIIESKKCIESKLGEEVKGFCYPNGAYNADIICILKQRGFHYSCTAKNGFNGPETDPFQLKRIGIHNDISYTLPLFACRITGLL